MRACLENCLPRRSLEAGPSRNLGIQNAKQLAGAPVLPLCVPTATAEAQAGSTRPSLSLAAGLIWCASLTCCLHMVCAPFMPADDCGEIGHERGHLHKKTCKRWQGQPPRELHAHVPYAVLAWLQGSRSVPALLQSCCLGMKQHDVRVADGGALLQVLTSRWRARCDAPRRVAVPVLRAVDAAAACIHLSTTGSSLYWASTVLHRASSVAQTYVRLAAATVL